MLKPYIAKVMNRQNLSPLEAEEAMNIIMTGQATQAQIGAYLVALRMKGETVEEITGSARAMRAQASPVPHLSEDTPMLDTAGTGGDGAHTFNISTTAAFVIAGAGRRVAKHGNRAASSQCGSADVLGSLGVNLDLTPDQVGQCIEQVGIGFLFAPKFHPAMRYAIGPRREIGQRTIFNLLGPLTNPAGAAYQLIGVYDPSLTQPIAEVFGALGGQAAYVVHGAGGLDELTTSGPNRVSRLQNGQVETFELDAAQYGLRPAGPSDLHGGDPAENAVIMRAILSGEDRSPRRDVVLFNAAAALATTQQSFESALLEAEESLNSGSALYKLDNLIQVSQGMLQ
jgi:anthranilate phosphoribosyltransferase